MASPFIKRYLLALERYKWAGLAGFLGVLGFAGVIALQAPPEPKYQSEGVLRQNVPLVSFTATGTEVRQIGQAFITEDFLLADALIEQVSDELARRKITISPDAIRRNTLIGVGDDDDNGVQRVVVRFEWFEPEASEITLGLLFEGMIELSRIANKARLRAIIEALDERLPSVENELRQAEQLLEEYDRIEGPAIQAALDGSLLGNISGSQQQRRQNLIILATLDAQMQSLQARLGLTPDQAYASSALSADPIIANLRTQILDTETQIRLLSRDLRSAHPTMVQLQSDLAAYEYLLRERAREVIGGGPLTPLPSGNAVRQDSSLDPARAALANELVSLKTQRDALVQQQQTLALSEVQLRQQYASLPNKQLERDRLAQQVVLKRALYDQIQAKRIDAEAAEAETVSSLTIAEPPATILEVPETPNKLVVLAGGIALGVMVGGGIVFLLDMLDGTVRTFEDLQGILRDQDIPVLGLIPEIRSRFAPILVQADTPYSDSYERCRSNLRLAGSQVNGAAAPKVVLITSTRDQEGKTISAFNLAIASARAGRRTLIVEADLRMPSQARKIGIDIDPQAIVEPLRYYGGQLGESVRLVPNVENLYISPSPGPQRQAAAIIESSEMRRFLDDARGRFDMVILDAPALSYNNDAMLLEGQTDGMILVTRPGYTEKAVLATALEQFEETEDIDLFGAIINGADVSVRDAVDYDDDLGVHSLADEDSFSADLEEVRHSRVDF